MNIIYLLTTADANAGTERAIMSQIENLEGLGHRIELISVYRKDGSAHSRFPQSVNLTYLIDSENYIDLTETVSPIRAVELIKADSNLIQKKWDNQFNALSDIVIRKKFSSLNDAVIMTTTPALAYLASLFVPESAKIVAQEHRATSERGIGLMPLALAKDSLKSIVSLNEENNNWVKNTLSPSTIDFRTISNSIVAKFYPKSSLDSKIIMAAGRLAPAKQFDHLINAFKNVAEEFPDWSLRIFGDGPDRSRLNSLIARENLSSRVQILPAVSDLNLEWAKASIHAMTSRSEGQSLVIMEAAASSVPTVSYDCPTGPRNLIEDGVSGRLVQLNSVAAMSFALAELMRDQKLRLSLGRAAFVATRPFLPQSVSEQWLSLLESLETNSGDITSSSPLSSGVKNETAMEESNDSSVEMLDITIQTQKAESINITAAKNDNYQFVRSVLDSYGINYFALEGYSFYRNVIAIRSEDKDRIMSGLTENPDSNLAIRLERGYSRLTHKDWYPCLAPQPYQLADANIIRVFHHLSDVHNTRVIGSVASTDIEVWELDEDSALYKAPRHNRLVDQLRSIDFTRNQTPFDTKLWSDIDFPIDIVYTWVDDTDESWLNRKRASVSSSGVLHPLAASDVRFRNRNELLYSIRSVRTYAPWANKIYLVTDRQVPNWLSSNSDIVVVDHRELFPDPGVLPTFNSHAIESVLHRIPGLSEHFLYLNDDVMFMKYQDPRTYFEANGLAKFFHSPVKIADLGADTEPHMWAAVNNRKLLKQSFGRVISQSMLHTPHPHRKSTLLALEDQFSESFELVRSNKFRAKEDISVLSSLAQHYGYFTGAYIPGSIRYTYAAIGASDARQRFHELSLDERFDVLALGESVEPAISTEDADSILESFFRAKFPYTIMDETPYVYDS